MKLSEFIKEARKSRKESLRAFGDRIGVSQTYVSYLESGRVNNPSLDNLKGIAKGLNIDLMTLLSEVDEFSVGLPVATNEEKTIKIPILTALNGNGPIETSDKILKWETLPNPEDDFGKVFGLIVDDDSMSPTIMKGDTVIVKKQDSAKSGDTVLVSVDNGPAVCRKFFQNLNGIVLSPSNNNYSPQQFNSKEIKGLPVEIIGKVKEVRRQL